jgi:nitronate monooxygenase
VPDRLGSSPLPTFDEASCAAVESLRPKVVSFHFGLPNDRLIARIKGAGVILMSSATTVQEARWLEDHGCDVIIAQGAEAGGYRGMFLTADVHIQLGTMALVPQVVDAVDAPVVAAGGIADGRAIAAAFALGASAVQMGTAFLFTSEANVSPQHRDALPDAANSETAIANVFSGHPARCVMNRVMREVGPMAEDAPAFPLGFSAIGPLRREGEASSHRDFAAHYAGQAAPLGARNNPSALDVVRALAEEANGSFRRMAV